MSLSKPDITASENGTLLVNYGESEFLKEISLKYDPHHNEKHGKHFKITSDCKETTVVIYGPGINGNSVSPLVLHKGLEKTPQSSFLSIGNPRVFPLNIKEKASELKVTIISPTGIKVGGIVKTLPNGTTGIRFSPPEIGKYVIRLKHPSKDIKGPLTIIVGESDIVDATKVKITGKNLSRCTENTDNMCIIDTSDAGNDCIGISVEGNGKCLMKHECQAHGKYLFTYKFEKVGEYSMSFKYGDKNTQGSPFKIIVEPKEDSTELEGTTDTPPLKKMRLATEEAVDKEDLAKSRILQLEIENSNLRLDNAHLARLLVLGDKRINPDISKDESSIIFVLDTNMLIHKLALVNKLKDATVDGCPVVICIPYIVTQELDRLKLKQKKIVESNIAVNYINNILQKHHSYYGQTINEAKSSDTLFGITGDNKVLECCLGLSSKFKNLYLLTRDVNLQNVAKSWCVNVYDVKTLEAVLKPGSKFGYKEIKAERRRLFGQTSEEVDDSDDDDSSNVLETSLTTSEDYSSE